MLHVTAPSPRAKTIQEQKCLADHSARVLRTIRPNGSANGFVNDSPRGKKRTDGRPGVGLQPALGNFIERRPPRQARQQEGRRHQMMREGHAAASHRHVAQGGIPPPQPKILAGRGRQILTTSSFVCWRPAWLPNSLSIRFGVLARRSASLRRRAKAARPGSALGRWRR